MTENTINTDFSENKPRASEWKRFRRVFFARGAVAIGLAILVLVFIMAVFADQLAPYDPYQPGGAP